MNIPMYRYKVDYLTRYSEFNPLLLFAQKYTFNPEEESQWRVCYANAIVFVEDGSGTLLLEGEDHRMRAGALVYIASGQPHQWISGKSSAMVHRCAYFDWNHVSRPGFDYQIDYFVKLDQPFDKELTSSVPDISFKPVLSVSNSALWLSYFNAFTMPPALLGGRRSIESLQYNAAFQTFLLRYLSLAARPDSWCDPRIAQILAKMDGMAFDQKNIDPYLFAKDHKLGKSSFYKLFKRETGHTPNEYVQLRRLHHAAEDLANSGLSVTEVSNKYQYSSVHYFSKTFRKFAGVSPSEYKAKSR